MCVLRYWPELDGIRAFAVLAVIAFHSDRFITGGYIGVDIFFVLSGFLITSLLADEQIKAGRISLPRFYLRRFWRLGPALLAFLAVYLLVAPAVWPDYPHGRDALIAGLYLSDYSLSLFEVPQYVSHTWSLAVEEHFYLLWPLLVPVFLRLKQPILWLSAAYVAATLWRFAFLPDFYLTYFRFDTRASGLILGCLIYFIKAKPPEAVGAASFSALLLLCLALRPDDWWSLTIAELASAALILTCVRGDPGALGLALRSRPSVAIGKLSYAMYLWHYPIAVYLREHHGAPYTMALTLDLSLMMAAVSYLTVEALGRRLRHPTRTIPNHELSA